MTRNLTATVTLIGALAEANDDGSEAQAPDDGGLLACQDRDAGRPGGGTSNT